MTWSVASTRVTVQAAVHEVLGELEADEAAAEDDGRAGPSGGGDQGVGVLDVAQRQGALDAGDRRADRARRRARARARRRASSTSSPRRRGRARRPSAARGRCPAASWRTRTSSPKRAARDCGVCSSSASRSLDDADRRGTAARSWRRRRSRCARDGDRAAWSSDEPGGRESIHAAGDRGQAAEARLAVDLVGVGVDREHRVAAAHEPVVEPRCHCGSRLARDARDRDPGGVGGARAQERVGSADGGRAIFCAGKSRVASATVTMVASPPWVESAASVAGREEP